MYTQGMFQIRPVVPEFRACNLTNEQTLQLYNISKV